MELPLQIRFRNMEKSPAVEAEIRKRSARLERFSHQIVGCRVVVEVPHRHHNQGKLYHVRVDITVPGGELVVNRAPAQHHAHEDVYIAIRDAFDAAARQLEDRTRRQRGQTKSHEEPSSGWIARLLPAGDCGFIETPDGREIYFHRNSLLGVHYERLQVGERVRFTEEQGDAGPQASTVRSD